MIVRFRRPHFMDEATGAEAGGAGGPVGAPVVTDTPPAAPVAAPPAAALTLDEPTAPVVDAAPAEAVVYEPTGDAGLDLALDYVGNLGFGPEHPAIQAAEKGDFSALEAALKGMGAKAKGFEKYLALGKQAIDAKVAESKARVEKDTQMVQQAVGGPENWNAIVDWAKANAEPAEKAAVNQALAAGGIAAKAMALYLAGLWQKSAGAEIAPAPVVQPNAAPSTGNAAGPLTARDFAAQSATLRQTLGHAFESTPQFQQLVARREAGRRQGV